MEAVDSRIAERLQLLSAAADIGTLSDEVKGLLANSRQAAQDVQAALGVFRDPEAILDLQMLPTRLQAIRDEAEAAQLEVAMLRGEVAKVREENVKMRAALDDSFAFPHAFWSTCVLPAQLKQWTRTHIFSDPLGNIIPGSSARTHELDTNMQLGGMISASRSFAVQAVGYSITGGDSGPNSSAPWLDILLQWEWAQERYDIAPLAMFQSVGASGSRRGLWRYPASCMPVIPENYPFTIVVLPVPRQRADMTSEVRLTVALYGYHIDLVHNPHLGLERLHHGALGLFRDLS